MCRARCLGAGLEYSEARADHCCCTGACVQGAWGAVQPVLSPTSPHLTEITNDEELAGCLETVLLLHVALLHNAKVPTRFASFRHHVVLGASEPARHKRLYKFFGLACALPRKGANYGTEYGTKTLPMRSIGQVPMCQPGLVACHHKLTITFKQLMYKSDYRPAMSTKFRPETKTHLQNAFAHL